MSASKCKEHRRDVTDVGIGVAPLVVGVLAARVADAKFMLKNLQAGTQRVVWAMGVGSTGSA